MSTDTAFALGALALAGRGVPDRVRTYLLTFAFVDDVAGIAIIALAYSSHIDLAARATAGCSRISTMPPPCPFRVLATSNRGAIAAESAKRKPDTSIIP